MSASTTEAVWSVQVLMGARNRNISIKHFGFTGSVSSYPNLYAPVNGFVEFGPQARVWRRNSLRSTSLLSRGAKSRGASANLVAAVDETLRRRFSLEHRRASHPPLLRLRRPSLSISWLLDRPSTSSASNASCGLRFWTSSYCRRSSSASQMKEEECTGRAYTRRWKTHIGVACGAIYFLALPWIKRGTHWRWRNFMRDFGQ